jgi:hypothetical protein
MVKYTHFCHWACMLPNRHTYAPLNHCFVHNMQICIYPCFRAYNCVYIVRSLFKLYHSSVTVSYMSIHLLYIDSIAKPA